ncbi:MAG: 7TM-DISM domain-containing protein [Saprospiraceae bacterium]
MNTLLKLGLLFGLCWLFSPRMEAHDTIFVDRHFDQAFIASKADWIYDVSKQLKPYQFADNGIQWQPNDVEFFNIQKEGRYWLRFTIYNQDSISLYLHLGSTSMDVSRLQLYVVSPLSVDSTIVTGNDFPLSKRPLGNADLCFRVFLHAQQYHTCYLYLEREATPVQTALLFYNPLSKGHQHLGRISLYKKGLLIGIAGLFTFIALLNLLFFPRALHLGYVLYTLGSMGYLTASMGVGMEALWGEYPYFESFSANFFAAFQFIGLIIMSRIVFQMPIRYRYFDGLLVISLIIAALYILMGLFRYVFPVVMNTYISITAAIALVLSATVVTLISFWNYYRYKEMESLGFFTVFGFIIGFAIVMLFTEIGIIPRSYFINDSMLAFVILLEVILATLFVANRLKNQFLTQARRETALHQLRQQDLERISRDLHDEMGSTLSSISILSTALLRNFQPDFDIKKLTVISERARQVMDTMSDIVWSVNPSNDELGAIVLRMREFAVETLEAKNILLHFETDEALHALQLSMEQRKDFYLIFKEAINNAAKYSHAQNIWATLEKRNKEICLEIRDDGNGFDINTIKQGNGLRNMQARAEQLGGELRIDSKKDQGTRFVLSFPVTS